jgi:hypothetical protein
MRTDNLILVAIGSLWIFVLMMLTARSRRKMLALVSNVTVLGLYAPALLWEMTQGGSGGSSLAYFLSFAVLTVVHTIAILCYLLWKYRRGR